MNVSYFAAALAAAISWSPASSRAQGLYDPMQPPALAAPAAAEGEKAPGLVLQSIILSKGRRIATIDGKPMKVGDIIGAAKIVAIDPASVTLREGNSTRVLELYQGVKITQEKPGGAPPPRKGWAERKR